MGVAQIGRSLLRPVSVAAVAVAAIAIAFGTALGLDSNAKGVTHYSVGQCKAKALGGVYWPGRLRLRVSCMTVTGIVDCVKQEPDGDAHLRILPDPKFRKLLTPANDVQVCAGGSQAPHLVAEIIPQHGELPFPENSATRGGFVTPSIPAVGAHVALTGAYVLDTNKAHDILYPGKNVANWAEIHPVWAIGPASALGK